MSHTASVSSLCVLGGSYIKAAEDDLLVGPLFALVHVAYVYPQTGPSTCPTKSTAKGGSFNVVGKDEGEGEQVWLGPVDVISTWAMESNGVGINTNVELLG
jgi:hypothetical protein